MQYEAVVVGTGFGGSVVACRLAQAGYRVLVLERGRRYDPSDFPDLPADGALAPDFARWSWAADGGLWDVVDLDELVTCQAAGYGGGSLIYANVHLRPPSFVFDEDWPEVYRTPKNLDPYFDLAAYMLDIAPIDAHGDMATKIAKSEQMAAAAERLGRDTFHPPLAVSRKSGPNRFGKTQGKCIGCGHCCAGCPEGAKNTLDFNYLAVAEASGAVMRTRCEVIGFDEIDPDDAAHPGARWSVRFRDRALHDGAPEQTATAGHLFVCAGSVHSTRLIAELERRRPNGSSSKVGSAYHPGGGAIGVVYDTEQPQHPARGPTITTAVVQKTSEKRYFMIQDGGYPPALARMAGTLRAPLWLGRNRVTRSTTRPPDIDDPPALSPRKPHDLSPPTRQIPSPLDALLDAASAGSFSAIKGKSGIYPAQLAEAAPAFMDEISKALLIESIVDQTVENVLVTRCPLLRSRHVALRWILPLLKRGFYFLFGERILIAQQAVRAVFSSRGLSRHEAAAQFFGYDDTNESHRAMFLSMGRDAASGDLLLDDGGQLRADLRLDDLAPGYSRSERLMADLANELGGELRTNPAWSFLGKPIAVHNQGGCPMGDVTDENGAVHGYDGLFVIDSAMLPKSVGVNPAATITAIAERSVFEFIRSDGREEALRSGGYEEHLRGRDAWTREVGPQRGSPAKNGWHLEPTPIEAKPIRTNPLALAFDEILQGYYSPEGADPGDASTDSDESFRTFETQGRPELPITLKMTALAQNLTVFFEDDAHHMEITGTISTRLTRSGEIIEAPISGHLDLLTEHHAPHTAAADGPGRGPGPSDQRFLTYSLEFAHGDAPWRLEGYKRVRDDPGLDAWRDTSHLFVRLFENDVFHGAGVVHGDLKNFLYHQLASIRVGHVEKTGFVETPDASRAVWAAARFATFFFGSLQRIYMPEIASALRALFAPHESGRRPR